MKLITYDKHHNQLFEVDILSFYRSNSVSFQIKYKDYKTHFKDKSDKIISALVLNEANNKMTYFIGVSYMGAYYGSNVTPIFSFDDWWEKPMSLYLNKSISKYGVWSGKPVISAGG